MRVLRLLVIPIAVFGLTAGLCSENPVEEALSDEDDVLIDIDKVNLDTEPVHILARFEDFPCCRVEPGDTNRASTVLARRGEQVEFRAGRNGDAFANVTCTVTAETVGEDGEGDDGDEFARVEFGFDQTLRCRDW